tara:strand:+ start:20 stop:556 length:537 start_codon:yes stop_codon:yes gene_type:complete
MKIHGTAKGAALSTKDFGVAFTVAETGGTYTWTDCGSDDATGIYYGTSEVGAWIRSGTLIGKKITKLTQKMYRIDASGNLTVIHKNDGGSTLSTSNVVAVNTLTTDTAYANASSVEFIFDSPVAITADDTFQVSTNSADGRCKLWASNGVCDSYATGLTDRTTDLPNFTPRGAAEWES